MAKDLMAIVGDGNTTALVKKNLAERDGVAASAVGQWLDTAPDLEDFGNDLNSTALANEKIIALESSITTLSRVLRLHNKPLAAAMQDSNASDARARLSASLPINVVLVSDMDLFAPPFFNIRAAGDLDQQMELGFNVDNISFVLNVVDHLSGDIRFLELRKKRRLHRTLTSFEERVREAAKNTRKMQVSTRTARGSTYFARLLCHKSAGTHILRDFYATRVREHEKTHAKCST